MPTLQDVAILAGVSTATVSRTLNNPELVDPDTRSKVAVAIKTSGYTRNETARSLATRSSRTIGLLTDNFASNYFAPMLDETISLLREYGYYAIVEATGNQNNAKKDTDSQKRAWRSLIDRQVESIIVLCAFMENSDLAQMLKEFPNSIVIGPSMDNDPQRCITVDHYIGGRVAARHLVENGHRNIVMVTGPTHRHDSRHRGQGFIDELKEHGVELSTEHIFTGDYTVAGGAAAMRKIIESGHNHSAVFAQNDDMALGVANECYNAGITVPRDISVIGFDNSFLSSAMSPPLTTISQPLELMSRSAAILALNISNGRAHQSPLPQPQTHFLPALIERKSVADIRA